ncbi:hypothetical protein TELCIR_03966 [Teladorsagia circumcincta]|uniref:CUB domain-containing protein n=1 Tax=Teladorsagia circumcincta TaxID=45464 RepID=A0A2G9UUW0_TELCI|nr:hypothetical protein TELCIR_03966 [Teladorsagia circumcincta]
MKNSLSSDEKARAAFRKAAKLWRDDTCIDIDEYDPTKTGTCANNKPACQNDGFAHPRDCSKCICPSGYGGPLCNKKPSSCGAEVEASSDWQSFENTLAAGDAGEERDEYKRCTYWIKVPDNVSNAKIEVTIVELPDKFFKDGCIYAGVEIKAHPDKRRTGYRFCSQKDVGTVLSSNSSLVPVITYSASRTDAFSTKLEYRYTLEEN